jgi:hypothetical protein
LPQGQPVFYTSNVFADRVPLKASIEKIVWFWAAASRLSAIGAV